MKDDTKHLGEYETEHGSYRSYLIGFALSLVLTFSAYFIAVEHVFSGWKLDAVLASLSLLQVIVQLVFFLHLLEESKPRNNLLVFLFMALVIVILVGGSLWIMNDLNYRMMPAMDMGAHT